MSTDPREIWGPKLWRILHLLADVSDRRDVCLLWHNVMKTTADVLPCALCRQHLQKYLRTTVFMKIKQPNLITGEQIRTQIMSELFTLHNVVNARLGKPIFPLESLSSTYSQGSRDTKLLEAKKLLEELRTSWSSQLFKTVMPGPFHEWKKSTNLLVALLT